MKTDLSHAIERVAVTGDLDSTAPESPSNSIQQHHRKPRNGDFKRVDRWRLIGWLFALPGLLLLGLTIGIPLIYSFVLSFSPYTLVNQKVFPLVGLANYVRVLNDPYVWHSLILTLQYTAVTVVAEFLLGLGVALLLNRVYTGRSIYFMILAVPLAISPVSVGLIWRLLLQPNLGIVNEVIRSLGGTGVDWLGSPDYAFWTVAFIDVWQQVSFVALILTAGLAALPKEPYEAAAIDGARSWQQFIYITLPMLRPVAAIVLIIQMINEIRTYDLIYVLTKGGPGVETELLSFLTYKKAFTGLAVNEGAASAFVLLAATMLLSVLSFVLISRNKQ